MKSWAADEGEDDLASSSESDDEGDEDEHDSPAVRELKVRRRQLKAVLREARHASNRSSKPSNIRRISSAKTKKASAHKQALAIFPGYTVVVFDTNILLTSLKLLRDLVEAETWTIVIPLAVVTELDGLRKNPPPLGTSADEALAYLESAIRTHARHLKVQTSRGNYLKDLSIRSEAIDFAGGSDAFSHDFARSMDDVIVRAVAWQRDHFVSRLALVNPRADKRQVPADASKVVLVTFDRNLRLKARARGLDSADERDMLALLVSAEHG